MAVSAKTMAAAYRIWAYASPRGWDLTVAEVAEALDLTIHQVGAVLRVMKWTGRLRVSQHHGHSIDLFRNTVPQIVGNDQAFRMSEIPSLSGYPDDLSDTDLPMNE